ncbi:MAG TPA: hypothetical protein VFA20_34920 [Myxococcaceae bacterium]|nr:hypothetical protein [Myxococcaceae bacterium]
MKQLANDLLARLKPILGQRWLELQPYATQEAAKIAAVVAKIELDKVNGVITEQQAAILFDMQKNASAAVFAVIKGVGQTVAWEALSAALEALKDPINQALGFKLL